jgi:hypothetical protein
VIEPLSLAVDYGVDVALLIDVALSAGFASMAEVDLDQRLHRNRSLRELAPQASSVIRAIKPPGTSRTPISMVEVIGMGDEATE